MTADRAFPALLRYWRSQRGLSQLDLGLNAGVSARHLSFLETGRSRPSVEMVMLLLETLDVPLRSRNEVLRAAGFEAHYPDPGIESMLAGPLALTVDLMLRHHEPFPMLVVDRHYEVAATNQAAARFLALAGLEHHDNVVRLLFDAEARPLVDDWQRTAGEILRRLQREVLHRPGDEAMADLLADLLKTPDIPSDWRQPDLAAGSEPAIPLRFRLGDLVLSFMTTITAFNAPINVTLDELRIESFFPLDEVTESFCRSVLADEDRPDPSDS